MSKDAIEESKDNEKMNFSSMVKQIQQKEKQELRQKKLSSSKLLIERRNFMKKGKT